jgi:hypothetical protein
VSREGVIVLNYWTYPAGRVCVYQFLFYVCDKDGKGAIHHTKSDQLTQVGAYYLEHMEVLFLRGARHRFALTFPCLHILCFDVVVLSLYAHATMRPRYSKQGKVLVSYMHQTQALRHFMMCLKSTPIYLHIFKIILKDTFWILSNTSL